jgi:hypothetical protein
MTFATFLHQLGITLVMALVYIGLMVSFPALFFQKTEKLNLRKALTSIVIISALSISAYVVSFFLSDPEFSNRILHAWGGGFLGFLICYLAASDAKLRLTKFQFFVFAFLFVSTLGVGNEISEYILQIVTGEPYAPHITDTWLDLISNTVGILIASLFFIPFIGKDTSGK